MSGHLTEVRTRLACPVDAEILHALVLELAAHEDSLDDVRVTVDGWKRLLSRDDVRVVIASDGPGAVGYASTVRRLSLWLGGDVLAMDDLYVREAARNRGVGQVLMAAVAGLAAPDRLPVVWSASLTNVDGHRFYQRLGADLKTRVAASWSPDDYLFTVSDTL
ncbi:GNAT family N-acetyltransferase [Cryobacterium sp. BB307]|uniref:GNAT family N-acetyltransferase n=1 Tax=Cryobacterium sp. BB307 TaxID=2716317 RepID=UPI001446B5B1|nr:GNAT family N-acetyltransferase [Cryobacterium sp. BB307]